MDTLLAIHSRDLRLAIDLLLREEPGVNVVGVAGETESLMALFKTTHPQVILLDWDLPGQTIPDVLRAIHTSNNPPKIIVLGNNENKREIALEAGADTFVVKGEPPQHLVATLREINSSSNQTNRRRKKE